MWVSTMLSVHSWGSSARTVAAGSAGENLPSLTAASASFMSAHSVGTPTGVRDEEFGLLGGQGDGALRVLLVQDRAAELRERHALFGQGQGRILEAAHRVLADGPT